MLANKLFLQSKRQSDFLEYIVNAQLDGKTEKLKEYALGLDVFGRDRSFDPGAESIVRVEASRLRAKLREFYDDDGAGDPVQIAIPKGHYVPVFQYGRSVSTATPVRKKWPLWSGLAATTLIAAVFYVFVQMKGPAHVSVENPRPPPSSIAVLPLRDLSPEPEDYFSVALTDALISSLANRPELRVTSLTSVMRYQNTEIAIPEIGRALDVAYIVEGSVYRDDEDVRITAQLISAPEDEHLWSASYDRPMNDILPMQTEVAATIVAQVSGELLQLPEIHNTEINEAARVAYMKGKYFYSQFTVDGFVRGMEFFMEAIEIEPEYAKAYAGLASCHCLLAGHGLEMVSPVIAIPEAYSLAMKARSLNPDLAEPVAFLGIINFKYEWDPESAETMLNRAIEMNPSLFQAYVWHSQVSEALGRKDIAISRARYAKQLNPLSLVAGLNLGWQLFQGGKYIEAESEIDTLIDFNPAFWGGHWVKGQIYSQHGTYEKAIEELQLAVKLEGGHSLPMSTLGYTYAIAEMHDQAWQIVENLKVLSNDVYVSPYHLATVYAGLNEPDLMFEALEHAYQVRARSLAWLHVAREMIPYRADARFQDLVNRIGIASSAGERFQTSTVL